VVVGLVLVHSGGELVPLAVEAVPRAVVPRHFNAESVMVLVMFVVVVHVSNPLTVRLGRLELKLSVLDAVTMMSVGLIHVQVIGVHVPAGPARKLPVPVIVLPMVATE